MVIRIGRPLVCSITGFDYSRTSRIRKSWVRQMAFAPFFLIYVVLPLVIMCAGLAATLFGSIWLAVHLA
jgi:hypothetical protein